MEESHMCKQHGTNNKKKRDQSLEGPKHLCKELVFHSVSNSEILAVLINGKLIACYCFFLDMTTASVVTILPKTYLISFSLQNVLATLQDPGQMLLDNRMFLSLLHTTQAFRLTQLLRIRVIT